jgi:hypothetical protein
MRIIRVPPVRRVTTEEPSRPTTSVSRHTCGPFPSHQYAASSADHSRPTGVSRHTRGTFRPTSVPRHLRTILVPPVCRVTPEESSRPTSVSRHTCGPFPSHQRVVSHLRTIPVSPACRVTHTPPSVAFSPQANYTDWATATCWWKLVPTFVDRGVSRGQRGGSPRSLISVF